MPRINYQKARKDYPKEGIQKGDYYYKWSIKTGPASGITFRSKVYPKPSQTTGSPFLQSYYAIQEQFEEIPNNLETLEDDINAVIEELENLRDETQDSLDSMPEQLQSSPTAELLQERIDGIEQDINELECIRDAIEEEDFDWNSSRDYAWAL